MKKQLFTLIELLVVIAIIAITTSNSIRVKPNGFTPVHRGKNLLSPV